MINMSDFESKLRKQTYEKILINVEKELSNWHELAAYINKHVTDKRNERVFSETQSMLYNILHMIEDIVETNLEEMNPSSES
jgi:hypothetical protein